MGNSLLDFVMALVRDREAADRFNADPSGALSAAGLTGVTAADVNNLLPMVADSIAATSPGFGMGAQGGAPGGNVWASGAATVAFDAFDMHRPAAVPPLISVDPVVRPAAQPPVETPRPNPGYASMPEIPDISGPQVDPTWIDDPGHDVTRTDPSHHHDAGRDPDPSFDPF
jgi:hypothetical protein